MCARFVCVISRCILSDEEVVGETLIRILTRKVALQLKDRVLKQWREEERRIPVSLRDFDPGLEETQELLLMRRWKDLREERDSFLREHAGSTDGSATATARTSCAGDSDLEAGKKQTAWRVVLDKNNLVYLKLDEEFEMLRGEGV